MKVKINGNYKIIKPTRLIIMKLTVAFVLLFTLNIQASTFGQIKVSVKAKKQALTEVLQTIEKTTPYRFLYNNDLANINKPVSINVTDISIAETMQLLLFGKNLDYQLMQNNLIVIKLTPNKEIDVTGKVLDAKGVPIAGASIQVKGATIGTTTTNDGSFLLRVPNADITLIVSYVGYKEIEIPLNGRTDISITLVAAETDLEQVVVIGYGTQKRKELTGTISTIKGADLEKMPNSNPIASLQGKVAGLTVSTSGRAGSSPVVRIRGVNSTNSASPVYVVNGVLHDNIDFLNPSDIESIDILKDPSAIAIYGMRGANGVIAVTLKQAARGKTAISFQTIWGQQKITNNIALTDAATFKKLYQQQELNQNIPVASRFDFTNYTGNTNWQDLIFRNAFSSASNLSISNSGEKSKTLLNIGYTNQEGVLKNDNYKRYLVRLNQEININKNIKVGGDITGYFYKFNPPAASITNALWAAPIVGVQNNEGFYFSMPSFQRAQVGNPIAALNRADNSGVDNGYRLIGNLFAEIKLLKHFTWRSAFYGDYGFTTERSYSRLPFSYFDVGEGNTPGTYRYDSLSKTSVSQAQSQSTRYQQDHTLTFDKNLGDGHRLNVLAGVTTINGFGSNINGSRRDTLVNIPDNPDLWYLSITNPNNPTFNGGGGYENASIGTFLRAAYSYKGKYFLSAAVRRDGSSKFSPENRWGTFGSIGASWIVSEEAFFRNIKPIDFFKLRVGWGTTGNANGFADNLYRPGISNSISAIFGDNVYPAIQASYLVDSNLHWEVVKGLDIGMDLKALQNKLNFEATFYNRTTSDILTSVTIPNDSRTKFTNLGEITNKGIELNAGWNDKIGNLGYHFGANYSYNKNVVNSIGDNFNFQIVGNGGVNLTRTGSSIGYFYGYKQVGVYQTTADLEKMPAFSTSLPGDIAYADIDGDGTITAADRTYLGTPMPPHSYGASLGFDYKGFDISIEGQGFAGHKIYTQRKTATFTVLNWEANRANAWSGAGTSNIEPIINNARGNNYLMSTYYLEPGDFFRLRTLQIGYALNNKALNNIGVQKIRLFISGQNIKTWSKVTGYSPEPLIGSILGGGADNGAYPVPAIYSIGLNVTF